MRVYFIGKEVFIHDPGASDLFIKLQSIKHVERLSDALNEFLKYTPQRIKGWQPKEEKAVG